MVEEVFSAVVVLEVIEDLVEVVAVEEVPVLVGLVMVVVVTQSPLYSC